jgi:UDP-N-acetylglucosamine--N-acetylmuramyl-(pentapeptide) pyrophosphoryl-undecaprenol N-acetylglucosamine transferase
MASATAASNALRIVMSGGGTGGHIFPALAIADQLRALAPRAAFLFVGARGRMEMERIPKAGYPIEGLWISGIQRRLTPDNLLFPLKLGVSLWQAWRILRRFRPAVAVGVGGYASGPTLEVATRMGIPTLIQEQNSFPGITNRLLGRRVDRICVAYEGMERFFPPEKIELLGNPMRRDLIGLKLSAGEGRQRLGLERDRPTLLVLGGSLGARSLNEAMQAAEDRWRRRTNVQVLWQVGRFYAGDMQNTAVAALPNVHARAFLEDMPAAYAAADVVLCRAGALTLSELAVLGKAAVLVPSPNVAEDHQTRNARALAGQGAAWMISDAEAREGAVDKALELLDAPEKRKELEIAIKQRARPEAALHIARAVLELAGH